ncbi:phage major capsid protein [Enterococcus sp. BWR-S5]|uniref:phage major capsid protein n=1 Tax=Enterococcus sp. BWR-S5 TaxID=2787714 RepID=UPI0019219AB4|nr:phage major capsid protein [Enterococcus sp. BWR-S5]MBL1223729.1 phage major capsid protein [Enterococcus sp. BWR-S5]
MNLADKREALQEKRKELEKVVKEKETVTLKLKEVTLTDNQLAELEEEASRVAAAVDELETTISALSEDITNEEKSLDAIAKRVKEKNEKTGGSKMKYLQTKEAVKDFAELLAKTGGGEKLKQAWSNQLKEKGITNPEVLLPQAVVTSITDAFEKSGSIFATFNHTGLTMLKVMHNTNTDDSSRAKGHKRGKTKTEQEITLAPKEIRAQYIFKYITLDKETIREQRDTNALINYVLSELPNRIISEIERAAMIGDGRASNDDEHIHSYEAIISSDLAYKSTQEETTNLLEDLVKMDATITADGARYLVVSRTTLADLKLTSNSGGLVFPIGSDMASALGYEAIFTPDFMALDAAPKAIEYVGNAYKVVGDDVMDSYEDFTLSQNKNEYLMEIYSGGGLGTFKSAAVLTKATP